MSKASLIKVIEGRIKFWEDKIDKFDPVRMMHAHAVAKTVAYRVALQDIQRELPDE